MPDQLTIDFYNSHAQQLSEKYDKASDIREKYLSTLLYNCTNILEIGCGSGRDASILAKAGKHVTACDASLEMLKQAKTKYKTQTNPVNFIHDSLPNLSKIEGTFEGIFCSAVFQHISENSLLDSLFRIKELLSDKGIFILSVPCAYPGITNNRDLDGRLFILRPYQKYIFLLERLGFYIKDKCIKPDSLKRGGITWAEIQAVKETINELHPLESIESVIRKDSKNTTYKLALLRSLASLASSGFNNVRWTLDGKVQIPLTVVAEKWIEYYWPLVHYSVQTCFIKQGTNRPADMAFRKHLEILINSLQKHETTSVFFNLLKSGKLDDEKSRLYNQLLKIIQDTIIKGPVFYSGGAVGEKMFDSAGKKKDRIIIMEAELWKELVLMGQWVEDSLILQWADLTNAINANNPEITKSLILSLLLQSLEEKRDTVLAKNIYKDYSEQNTIKCVWTGGSLKKYDIDHAIPFVLMRNNDLWNLLPAAPKINNQKRDKLPSRKLIQASKKRISNCWNILYEAESKLFLYQASEFSGINMTDFSKEKNGELFTAFNATVELTAAYRSVERWGG